MSFRPFPYTATGTNLSSYNVHSSTNINTSFKPKVDNFQGNAQSNLSHHMNQSNIYHAQFPSSNSPVRPTQNSNEVNFIRNNTFVAPSQATDSVPFPTTNFVNARQSVLANCAVPPPNFNLPRNQYQPNKQYPVSNLANPLCSPNIDQRNVSNQPFRYPIPSESRNNVSPAANYSVPQGVPNVNVSGSIVPKILPPFPQIPVTGNENVRNFIVPNTNYAVVRPEDVNKSLPPPVFSNPIKIPPPIINAPLVPPPAFQKDSALPLLLLQTTRNNPLETHIVTPESNCVTSEKEIRLAEFLEKFSASEQENKNQITVPEFRYAIKAAIHMIKLLKEKKSKLSSILDANESEWRSEIQSTVDVKNDLSALCTFISTPDHLNNLMKKLKLIKRKREGIKKSNINKVSKKLSAEQKKKEIDQEIDKWLDDIKEKNQKLKREAEMKKEADFILLEVRKKIHEANKTIEKIKVFEKLRNARQANSVQKGLHIQPQHNETFARKMLILKETMLRQLADYEAEEKALKVMLETEQEGQREEEAQWKIKKFKTLQQKKHKNIIECLFGVSDDPLPTDPLYLFHKYHTSATNSIESFIQIRHPWDIHLSEDGEAIPRQWVVPVAPSNPTWDQYLISSKT